jgi:hypothetical protein
MPRRCLDEDVSAENWSLSAMIGALHHIAGTCAALPSKSRDTTISTTQHWLFLGASPQTPWVRFADYGHSVKRDCWLRFLLPFVEKEKKN